MKKIVKVLICLIIMGVVLALVYYNMDNRNYKKTDAYKFKQEYESLNGKTSSSGKKIRNVEIAKDNKIIYSNAKEVVSKIDKGESFLVYFGFASCPWCRSMVESMIAISIDKNIDIYYVDVLNIRDILEYKDGKVIVKKEADSDYLDLLDRLSSVLSDYDLKDEEGNKAELDEKRIYAPNVVSIINGVPNMLVEGVSDDLEDPYSELTDKMKRDSRRQLEDVFNTLNINNICTKEDAC